MVDPTGLDHYPDKRPWWHYDKLASRVPCDWSPATRGGDPWDQIDFHLDIGCGTVPKARMGIDRFYAEGVDLMIDLEELQPATALSDHSDELSVIERTKDLYRLNVDGDSNWRLPKLPFPDDSINGVITHHCLEHIDAGFLRLMDEIHRVMVPGSFFRIIVPLFPSYSAIADPDHKRYFLQGVWETFCGTQDGDHWMESFSVPYTNCRFEMVKEDRSPPTTLDKMWTPEDAREMRATLRKWAK